MKSKALAEGLSELWIIELVELIGMTVNGEIGMAAKGGVGVDGEVDG